MRQFNKIFVISLPRCATVSLNQALGMLGIPSAHLGKIYGESGQEHYDHARLQRIYEQLQAEDFDFDILRECRGLIDYPVCCMHVIKQLDRTFPGSLFVNVRRDDSIEGWLQSVERQFIGLELLMLSSAGSAENQAFMRLMLKLRKMAFGQSQFDASVYREAYLCYQSDVDQYFRERRRAILEIADVAELDYGFTRLAGFLEIEMPAFAFPRNDDHSLRPKQTFMRALAAGEVQSQTGIVPTSQ